MDYHREDRVDIRIARIFNTYGTRMAEADGRVVSNFIVQALRGQELTLYGTGEQTRSFCYVDDLVEGLMRLMAAEGRHEPVNLGNPVEFTIRSWPSEVSRIVGGEVQMVYRPLPQDDPTQRQPDITRAREWLGWEPKIPASNEGLVKTIAYFRERLTSPMRGPRTADAATGITASSPATSYASTGPGWLTPESGTPSMNAPRRSPYRSCSEPPSPLGLACARNPVTGKNEIVPGLRGPGDPDGQAGGPGSRPDDGVRE